MTKITLVFYQYPEAEHELLNWEKTQDQLHKEIKSNGKIIYTLIDKDEKLYCFDINNFSLEEVYNIFCYSDTGSKISSYTYNKVLIFGKINYINLVKIQQLLIKFEI